MAYFKYLYLDSSVIGQNTESTYYNLGRKEFIEYLVAHCEVTQKLSDYLPSDLTNPDVVVEGNHSGEL